MELKRFDELGGLDIIHNQQRNFAYTPHRHDEIVISAYLGTTTNYLCHKHSGFAPKGSLIIISPDVIHGGQTMEGQSWNFLSIYPKVSQISKVTSYSESEILNLLGFYRLIDSTYDNYNFSDQLISALSEPEGQVRELALSVFFVDLFASMDTIDTDSKFIPKNLSLLNEQFRDIPAYPFTLQELSEQVGLSPEHLCRSYKAAYGLTPFQMISIFRTQSARDLIRSGNKLVDAALLSGFTDQSHMNKWFRRVYGITPGNYM